MTRAITIALLLAICSPARADERVSLTMGRFTAAGDYGYSQQALSVKNSTEAAIEWVALECGFFHGDQLVATGVDSVVNLQAGQTGYCNRFRKSNKPRRYSGTRRLPSALVTRPSELLPMVAGLVHRWRY